VLVELEHEVHVAQLPDLKLWRLLPVDHARAGRRSGLGLKP
jgi:hypothetical protein